MKKQLEIQATEEKIRRNELLNRNMLNDEDLWVMVQDDSKPSNCHENSTGIQVEPSSVELAREFIRCLPIQPKKTLFVNQFTEVGLLHWSNLHIEQTWGGLTNLYNKFIL